MKQHCRFILAVCLLTLCGLTVAQEQIESSTSVGTLPSTSGLNMNRTNELDISYMSSKFSNQEDQGIYNNSIPGIRIGYGKKVWLQSYNAIGVSTTFNPEFFNLSESGNNGFAKGELRMTGLGYMQKMTMHFLSLGNVIELSGFGGFGYADAESSVKAFGGKLKSSGADFYQRLGLELGLNIAEGIALTAGYSKMFFEPSTKDEGSITFTGGTTITGTGEKEKEDLDMEAINVGCSARF